MPIESGQCSVPTALGTGDLRPRRDTFSPSRPRWHPSTAALQCWAPLPTKNTPVCWMVWSRWMAGVPNPIAGPCHGGKHLLFCSPFKDLCGIIVHISSAPWDPALLFLPFAHPRPSLHIAFLCIAGLVHHSLAFRSLAPIVCIRSAAHCFPFAQICVQSSLFFSASLGVQFCTLQ